MSGLGQKPTSCRECSMSALRSTADTCEPQEHQCSDPGHGTPPITEAPVSPADAEANLGGPKPFLRGGFTGFVGVLMTTACEDP